MSRLLSIGLSAAIIGGGIAGAQDAKKPTGVRAPIKIQQMVSPSFKVTPMLHQFESRRGKVIPFEFSLETVARPTRVEFYAVSLRQDESGVILPGDKPLPAGHVKFDTESDFVLPAGELKQIRGEIKVPTTDTNFHSYGILVRDFGVETDDPNAPVGARVRLKFITQYLCRCDITVPGARSGDLSKLEIERGELIEAFGLPQARVYVTNPTDSPFEFEMKCRVSSRGSNLRRKQFNLLMPSRASQEDQQRLVARILPHSRIRLESIVPDPVFDGDYDMEADLLAGGRSVHQAKYPMTLRGDSFLAQEVRVAQASPGISISPAQIELSAQRGGDRIQTVTISNQTNEPATVKISPQTMDGLAADWLSVRPAEVSVPGGASRKVSLTLAGPRDVAEHRYGRLLVQSQVKGSDTVGEARLMTAVLGKSNATSQLEFVDLQFDPLQKSPTFLVKVANTGNTHSSLDGRITLSDDAGQTVHMFAGYGRWLLPGESSELRFPLGGFPPEGNYQMRTEIRFAESSEPLARVDNIRLAPPQTSDATPDDRKPK